MLRNFNTEPDAQACMMVGSGYANSVDFRNVGAILKVGYVPNDSDVVTAVVFRDLAGQLVSGAFTVTIDNDGKPVATYPASGDGQTIVLDFGAGVSVVPTIVSNFYLVVPARDYTKGFRWGSCWTYRHKLQTLQSAASRLEPLGSTKSTRLVLALI